MAITVSHAMRRYPTSPPDSKYTNYSPLRSEESGPSLGWHSHSHPGDELVACAAPGGGVGVGGGSALSRSMRYAEPWLYGSVRGAPVLLAYPPPHHHAVGAVSAAVPAALLHLCTCTEYVHGTAARAASKTKGPQMCKKCKGTRLPLSQPGGTVRAKYGTVRGYPASVPNAALTGVRSGTVRVSTSSRPSILPSSPTVDPYDLMRRSRLSCPDVGSQFRARSTSPNKSRGSDNRNYSSSRPKNQPRSPSPSKNVVPGRKSILECDVNPYELMSTDNDKKDSNIPNGKVKGKIQLESEYEDIDVSSTRKSSQIPKLQQKTKKTASRRSTERESTTKFKSILKKPSAGFSDTDSGPSVGDCSNGSASSKSGSHFYLPMPTVSSPRKKVQFLVENERERERNNDRKDAGKAVEMACYTAPPLLRDSDPVEGNQDPDPKEIVESESAVVDDDEEDIDEPCRLKRSLSERLGQGISSISFNDTMALRPPRGRGALTDGALGTLFDAVTDLQRLDGIGPARPRPREPPPPPPPPSLGLQQELQDLQQETLERPATPPPRSATELGGFEVTTIVDSQISAEDIKRSDLQPDTTLHSCKTTVDDEKPPAAPPRKRSSSKQPFASLVTSKKDTVNQAEALTDKSSENNKDNASANQNISLDISVKEHADDVSSKSAEAAAHTKIENSEKLDVDTKTNLDLINDKTNDSNDTFSTFLPTAFQNTNYEETSLEDEEKESIKFEPPKITIKSAPTTPEYYDPVHENISSMKIESSDIKYSYQKVKIEPSKTIVQITSPNIQVIPSTVHRLQIKNEFPECVNYNKVSITESPQRKTSIMINGDDCYSTVNVNDDVPIYQSSVVVNDYDSSKPELGSGSKSSSVYITGDFQSNSINLSSLTSRPEERPKKTLVILEGNFSVPSTPSPTVENEQASPETVGKTFVVLQQEPEVTRLEPLLSQKNSEHSLPQKESEHPLPQKEPVKDLRKETEIDVETRNKVNEKLTEDYEKPSYEELQRLLKDPVEAVKRNLVPHVCGKADVDRKPKNKKPITSNSLVARLLEDPFLGSLAEGLETNTVAKLIEDSLIKLRSQDFQDDDKDACSENESCPPYELMEAGSDCYSNHSNRSSVTEEELGTRNKFYQLLADAALSEIEDHHYECIKPNVDPIYEEIEIPPPLPSNPPPSSIVDDLQIDKQFTTRSIFEGASKYDILSYLVDAKERGIVPEESYTYNFNNSGDVIVEEEEDSKGNVGVFSSRVSHMSTVSDSSEDSSLVITADKNGPQKPAEVERNDSGVGSETSKCSRSRYLNQPEASIACEDCDLAVDPQPEDGPLICKKCSKKRSERKEIITEIVETEEKYSRDLQIILEEFYQPMLVAGLLTPEQLSAIFLNVEELLENSQALAERLRDTLEIAVEQGDEDLLTVNIGKIFLEAAPMLHAFESYCVRQGPASLLLAGLEKEKELLRIFLRVSQMENTVLRRMNLNSFLMVPVQRVTKYPLLLARLHKVTPLHHESRDLLREAQHKIELHLSHMNSETKDVPSKLWRRISSGSGRRSSSEMDLVNIKLRKIAVDVLEWNHDEARFALEGRLLFTQPTDNNWRKGRTIKLTPVNALLVTNGKPNPSPKAERNGTNGLSSTGVGSGTGNLTPEDNSTGLTFPRHTGVREAALLLVRDKGGRYSLLREPLYLDRCVIATDPAWQSYFEVQELLGKDTFIFKAEDAEMTRTWYRQLQYHAQGMGAWRKRRNALANIMINGMGSRS